MLDGTLAKVVSWYDNEWGYSNRCVELAQRVAGACARLTTSTSRASASSSGWTSTSRWTTAAITDDSRIRGALPTLRELREKGAAKLVLLAHLGRPKDREPEFSLKPAAERLAELLETEVALAPDLDESPTPTW